MMKIDFLVDVYRGEINSDTPKIWEDGTGHMAWPPNWSPLLSAKEKVYPKLH